MAETFLLHFRQPDRSAFAVRRLGGASQSSCSPCEDVQRHVTSILEPTGVLCAFRPAGPRTHCSLSSGYHVARLLEASAWSELQTGQPLIPAAFPFLLRRPVRLLVGCFQIWVAQYHSPVPGRTAGT
ncbi:hypothetical protein DT87_31035 [Streptomyces sp. NTK 937]|nr:hypothetical protein DT87_31035 [Streptomyces sp. NTK 937]